MSTGSATGVKDECRSEVQEALLLVPDVEDVVLLAVPLLLPSDPL